LITQEMRSAEHKKYERAYSISSYAMGPGRKKDAMIDLKSISIRGSYLDVGCGRGEMLDFAKSIGFRNVCGTEIIDGLIDDERVVYGEVHKLPFLDNYFDVVSMFDVIEHLIPGDDEAACKELGRIAKHRIILTANNKNSIAEEGGPELHINRRLYTEWDEKFREWFSPSKVFWLKGQRNWVSEAWRVEI